jgi:hypothetical protein
MVEKRSKAVAGFGERMTTASAAQKALLEKWQASKIDTNDPVFLEKQAQRLAAAAARDARDAQRKAEKDAARLQVIADRKAAKEAAEAQVIADRIALETAKSEAAVSLAAQEAQRKALRDARYAARKARV